MEFRDARLGEYWRGNAKPPRYVPPDVRKRLVRKLQMLAAARSIADLLTPPSNRLKRLSGDLDGRYSIRVNDQWRLVFVWNDREGAQDVEFVDYH